MTGTTTKVHGAMTSDPVTVPSSATLREAARAMRDRNTGDVPVADGGAIVGLVMDQDIVVMGVAAAMTVQMICAGEDIATVSPSDAVTAAIDLMKRKAVRRLPVFDGKRPVGIVSLGDLAMEAAAALRARRDQRGAREPIAPDRRAGPVMDERKHRMDDARTPERPRQDPGAGSASERPPRRPLRLIKGGGATRATAWRRLPPRRPWPPPAGGEAA